MMWFYDLSEAVRCEAGFKAFWGSEYTEKECGRTLSGYNIARKCYALNAVSMRASDDVRALAAKVRRMNERAEYETKHPKREEQDIAF